MIGKVISVLISILITLIGIFGAWISIHIHQEEKQNGSQYDNKL
ncbi:hypothetical protein [Treponema sp.]